MPDNILSELYLKFLEHKKTPDKIGGL